MNNKTITIISFILILLNSYVCFSQYAYNTIIGDTIEISQDLHPTFGVFQWQIMDYTDTIWTDFEGANNALFQEVVNESFPNEFSIRASYKISDTSSYEFYSEEQYFYRPEPDLLDMKIGGEFRGGYVFCVDSVSEEIYICSKEFLPEQHYYGCVGDTLPGADSVEVGGGFPNTLDIINNCMDTATAAYACYNLVHEDYDDWFLPTVDELIQIALEIQNRFNSEYAIFLLSSKQTGNRCERIHIGYGGYYNVLPKNKDVEYDILPVRSTNILQLYNLKHVFHSNFIPEDCHPLIKIEDINNDLPLNLISFTDTSLEGVNYEWILPDNSTIPDFETNIDNDSINIQFMSQILMEVSLNIYLDSLKIIPTITSCEFRSNSIYQATDNLYGELKHGIVEWGDFNNDDLLDFIVAGSNRTEIYKNIGNDQFVLTEQNFIELDFVRTALNDINNDNYLDFIICGLNTITNIPQTNIYINNGDFNFSDLNVDIIGVYDGDIACFDYNLDGWSDILITGATDTAFTPCTKLYLNNNTNFSELNTSIPNLYRSRLNAKDIDKDGYNDIVIQGKSNDTVRHLFISYYNEGYNSFVDLSSEITGLSDGDFSVEDFDNDGENELFLTGENENPIIDGNSIIFWYSSTFMLFDSIENGIFDTIKNFNHLHSFRRSQLDYGDYNNSGRLDIYATGNVGGYSQLQVGVGNISNDEASDLNQGTYTKIIMNINNDYTDAEFDVPLLLNGSGYAYLPYGHQVFSISTGDFNGDGNIDMIRSGAGDNEESIVKIYKNQNYIENNPPSIPQNLSFTMDSVSHFSWSPPEDDHTPSQSLKYKIYIRDGFDNYKVSKISNDYHLDTCQIHQVLTPGIYHWSCVALDGAKIKSNWAAEQTFIIPSDILEICSNDSVLIYGNYQNQAGYYFDTISESELAVTKLEVLPASYFVDTQNHCESFTWLDGVTYSESNNTAIYTMTNQYGCDSIIMLDLTINSNTGIDIQEQCDSYEWINGEIYTESNNTATYTLINEHGCDSVVTLNLTIITVETPEIILNELTYELVSSAQEGNQWYFNTEEIIDANTTTYLPEEDGIYNVKSTILGCSSEMSDDYIYNLVNIGNNITESISVYPNPTSSTIQLKGIKDVSIIQIINNVGVIVKTVKLEKDGQIDVSELVPATYLMRVHSQSSTTNYKIIKY